MKINQDRAKDILIEEANIALKGLVSKMWIKRIDSFSNICEKTSKTHIAFLGTVLLAKSVDITCDAFSVKASDESSGAYSARGLAHNVLVPQAAKLNVNLGVNGREPLNNQPYFRIKRVSHEIPVHDSAKATIDTLINLLKIINQFECTNQAREALRAFIFVRRQYHPTYEKFTENVKFLNSSQLSDVISKFVTANSEGGKCAQAVVAGLLDFFAGVDRVFSGRINDPDRDFPGDVGLINSKNSKKWDKVFEVRDKKVNEGDIYLFLQKAKEFNVTETAIVCTHLSQKNFNISEIQAWANERNMSITLYIGWDDFIQQIAFWCDTPQLEGIRLIPKLIRNRLIEIEVSENAVLDWVNHFKI